MEMIFKLIPQLFAVEHNTNVTTQTGTGQDMTPQMKIYYDTELLENSREKHVFTQFGRKQGLPAGNGNEIEWRKWNTFAPALDPLTEGVNPTGKKFGSVAIKAACTQHGDFTTVSDKLELQAIDPIIMGATEEMGAAGGQTMDILTRNAIIAGTHVLYAPKVNGDTLAEVTTRAGLDATAILSATVVNRAYTQLKKMNAPTIGGKYIAIIHPSCSYDLRESKGWIEAHKYAAVTELFNGEIGELHNIRFIESGNVKVISNGTIKVYLNLFFGKDAYGVVDPAGAGMEMIIHDKASGGTSNPLNLYSTIGYKFMHGAKILYEERLLRVECGSFYSGVDEEN